MLFNSKQEALEIISEALDAFKAVCDGRVNHKNKPVLPDFKVWGAETDEACFTCLAGAWHLVKTGRLSGSRLYKEPLFEKETIESRLFLNGLRLRDRKPLESLRQTGITIPPQRHNYDYNNPQHVIEFLEKLLQINQVAHSAPVAYKKKQQETVSVRAKE